MIYGSNWQHVVATARQEAKDARDWGRANAIERAQRYLANPRVERVWDETSDTLIVVSSQSGETYLTNGTCQRLDGTPCPAFADGRPCWHIEAKGLLHRLVDSIPPPEADTVPQPAPEPSPTDDPSQLGAQAPLPELAPALLELASRTQRQRAGEIPLIVDSTVVAYAATPTEADHWFRHHEPFFLSLED